MKRFTRSLRVIALVATLIGLSIAIMPATAAAGATIVSYELNISYCFVDVTIQVEDAGFYAVNFWDDGNFIAGAGADIPAGGTAVIQLTIGNVILQGAPGIGVYVQEAVGPAASVYYDAESPNLWEDNIGLTCFFDGFQYGAYVYSVSGDTAACPYPLPAGSAVYNVPAGALAFYAADASTYTGFNLSPGTWYISEFTDDYAKVWIACQAQPVYIPIDNVIR